jgi:hypothetical protein
VSLVASTGPSRGRSQCLLLVSVGTTFRTDTLHNLSRKQTIGYIWIFRSSINSTFQRIKRQGNWRFLQADMAESPMVAHAEILNSKQC